MSDLGIAELALAGTALLLFGSSKGEPSRGLLQQVVDAARTVVYALSANLAANLALEKIVDTDVPPGLTISLARLLRADQ